MNPMQKEAAFWETSRTFRHAAAAHRCLHQMPETVVPESAHRLREQAIKELNDLSLDTSHTDRTRRLLMAADLMTEKELKNDQSGIMLDLAAHVILQCTL